MSIEVVNNEQIVTATLFIVFQSSAHLYFVLTFRIGWVIRYDAEISICKKFLKITINVTAGQNIPN